ncbi:MAG: transposase [Verrucomicrobia bacterium]|nr:MAG: transposase [Verrucomicrobiota bacterium]
MIFEGDVLGVGFVTSDGLHTGRIFLKLSLPIRRRPPAWRSSSGQAADRHQSTLSQERTLRIYFLQQWYGLADEALEDALYDSQALQ